MLINGLAVAQGLPREKGFDALNDAGMLMSSLSPRHSDLASRCNGAGAGRVGGSRTLRRRRLGLPLA